MDRTEELFKHVAVELMHQIDAENTNSSYWMMSVIQKLATGNPKMTLAQLKDLAEREMPCTLRAYRLYTKNT